MGSRAIQTHGAVLLTAVFHRNDASNPSSSDAVPRICICRDDADMVNHIADCVRSLPCRQRLNFSAKLFGRHAEGTGDSSFELFTREMPVHEIINRSR